MERSRIPPRSSSFAAPSAEPSAQAAQSVARRIYTTSDISGQQLRRVESEGGGHGIISRNRQPTGSSSSIYDRPRISARVTTASTGESWKDFLRETGRSRSDLHRTRSNIDATQRPLAENSRSAEILHRTYSQGVPSSSLARKRVPSIATEEGYGNKRPYGVSTPTSPTTTTTTGSATNPIDISSSPPQPQMTRPRNAARSPSGSSIVIPRWQPDSEVDSCPVCGTPFTLFYRKHHCRKCGRVVCANCSPHRITIPRQFIVQQPPPPPSSPFWTVFSVPEIQPVHDVQSPGGLSLTRTQSSLRFGGETVRVCNPCVPDPNFSPPPQIPQLVFGGPQSPSAAFPHNFPASTTIRPPTIPPHHPLQSHPQPASNPPSYQAQPQIGAPSLLPNALANSIPQRERAASHPHHNHATTLLHARQASNLAAPVASGSSFPSRILYGQHPGYLNPYTSRQHRRSASAAVPTLGHLNPYNPNAPLPPLPFQQHAVLHRPRPIREEDECPVCGGELPPKGADGDEGPRERHIEECIRLYSAPSTSFSVSSVPVRQQSAPVTVPATEAGSSTSAPSRHSHTALATSSASTSARPPLSVVPDAEPVLPVQRPQQHRMLLYHATEKDCVGEDGERQECVICFEEFEEGDEMARLDCLCKFHRACIREWWATKGPGSCPTHQLHD